MNFKTTIILLLLLIGAGVFLLVDKYHGSKPENSSSENKEAGAQLFDVAAADIDTLKLQPSADLHQNAVSLVKTNGDWELTEPVAAKADKFKVDSLLEQIVGLRATDTLDESKAATEGLQPPRLTVTFTAQVKDAKGNTQSKTYNLAVGDRSALGDMLYVQPGGSKKIDVVAGDVYENLLQPADTFRDAQLVTASTADINHVEIDREGGKLILDKVPVESGGKEAGKKADHWEITSPQRMPADASQVTDLLAAITGLRAASWVPNNSPEATLADIDRPQLTLHFSTGPATTMPSATKPAEVTIAFGRYEDILHQAVFAKVSTSPYLVKVSAMPLQTFQLSALDFRDRNVLDINPAEVSRIHVKIQTPATKPSNLSSKPVSHDMQRQTIVVERAKAANELPEYVAAPGFRPDSATAQAMQKRMEAFKLPSQQHPAQWVIVSNPMAVANAERITALLDKLHPLVADHFLDKSPVTQPATQPAEAVYVLRVTTQAAGGATPKEYDLHFTDRGPAETVVGEYNGLTFELPHSMVNPLEGNFTQAPKPETPPNGAENGLGSEEGIPGQQGGDPRPALLGNQRGSLLTARQLANPREILEAFENPRPQRDYEIQFIFPEFTSVCPVTGQPDFATIRLIYVPDRRCVEMKSLKLYFLAYRNQGIFYEAVVNTILDDLLAVLSPRSMTVVGEFNVRGGTAGIVTARYEKGAGKSGKSKRRGS